MKQLSLLVLLSLSACGEVEKLAADAGVDDPCTGTCECRIDTDCAGTHTVCDDQITNRTCECAAGYIAGVGGACEWSGVVEDPGFQSTARWTLGTGVAIDQNLNVAGMIDPGVARFTGDGLCNLQRANQGVVMPKLSRAEPLVVVTTYRYTSVSFEDFAATAIGVGTAWHDESRLSFGQFETSRFCLGAASYAPESSKGKGVPLPVELMPTRRTFDCAMPGTALELDHVEIKPADPGECPVPGSASNGDAEGLGGWAFNVSFANGPDSSTASIQPGVGEAASAGAKLFMNRRCDGVALSNTISIPDSATLASPAISIFNRTSSGATVNWSLAGVPLPTIAGSGQPSTIRMCAPAFTRGGAVILSANIDGSGACADTPNFESTFDNFKLINDPSCGTDTTITDAGFESPLALIGASANQGRSLARTLNDPANAHGGAGVLQLSVDHLCEGPRWQANVVTPPSSATGGPALTFFYKATPKASYDFAVFVAGASFSATSDNQYHQGTICLDPKLIGRSQSVQFTMSGGGGTCATVIAAETAFVDDLAVITDPTCPTQ